MIMKKTSLLIAFFFLTACSDSALPSPIGDSQLYRHKQSGIGNTDVYKIFTDALLENMSKTREDALKKLDGEKSQKSPFKSLTASISESALSHLLTDLCIAKGYKSIALYATNGEAIALSSHKGLVDEFLLHDSLQKATQNGNSTTQDKKGFGLYLWLYPYYYNYHIIIRAIFLTPTNEGSFTKTTESDKLIGFVRWIR